MIKDAEYQMQQRGAVSDRKLLLVALEDAYSQATSESDFYIKLQGQHIKLYARNNTIVGAKLKRKFRFKTFGYDKSVLQELDRNPAQDKRLSILKSLRKHQQEQDRQQPKGCERTRKRGR